MSNKTCAGVYFGKDKLLGYTLSVYLPNGRGGHFVSMMGKYYLVTRSEYTLEGDVVTSKYRPLLKQDVINEDVGKVYFGEKIVYENNKDKKDDDFIEYLVTTDTEPFNDILDPQKESIYIGDDGDIKIGGECGLPPFVELFQKGKALLPIKEVKKEEAKPEAKVEPKKVEEIPTLISIESDLKDLNLKAVFGYNKSTFVGTYFGYGYVYIGVTQSFEIVILPAFMTSKTAENTPWNDMVHLIKQNIDNIDYFICKDYDNILPKVLSEVYPQTIYCKQVWNLPSDVNNKSRIEEVGRIFEKEVNDYWMMNGGVKSTEALIECIENLRKHLDNFFANYQYMTILN